MIQHSVIISCEYDSAYDIPNKSTIYYHKLELVNGESGNCGTYEKYPEKLQSGKYIYYQLEEGRIKLKSKFDYEHQ